MKPTRWATARWPGAGHQPHLAEGQGFTGRRSPRSKAALPSAFDIKFVFNQWTLGEDFCTQVLGIPAEKLNDPTFDLLTILGFSKADIEAANTMSAGDDAGRRAAS
jgi:ribonucleoside-diphosphate reductase alpha chain